MDRSARAREAFMENLFDRISGRYDLLNRIISARLDIRWRRKTIEALGIAGTQSRVLDLGTGTGDLAMAAYRVLDTDGVVIGLDLSRRMLRGAQEKLRRSGLDRKFGLVQASASATPIKAQSFDAVMSAFVLRNVGDLKRFFDESYRVLRPGGSMASLDMFPPRRGVFSLLYALYFYRIMPWIAASLARDRAAYRYLSESVQCFMSPEELLDLVRQTGFVEVKLLRYLRGAVCLVVARRAASGVQ